MPVITLYVNRTFYILFSLVVLLAGCKKDHSVLGVDVQPGVDDLNAESVRGLPVNAHTLAYDSIVSFNDRDYEFLGNNDDPVFGKMDIGLYLNTNISVTNLNFGATATLTSAEMIFVIDNTVFAGDKSASLTYSVFPLDSSLDITYTRYYFTSNHRLHNQTPICVYTGTFTTSTTDPTPCIRIPIDKVYAESLMHDTPNLVDNTTFLAKYKGYYIAASITNPGTEGTIFKTILSHDLSGLHLHYIQPDAPNDTLDFKFAFNTVTPSHFNTVKFTPSTVLKNNIQDSTLGANALYLKGMGMTKLKIQIPFLKNYSDSFQVSVNRAELIFQVAPSVIGSGTYNPPPVLTLLSIDSLGRETYIQDLISATDYTRFDGTYDSNNNRYVFNLAREAQLIFRGKKKNNGFYLVVAGSTPGYKASYFGSLKEMLTIRRDNYIERVVLAGTNTANKPVFNLNYVKFKND